MPAEVPRPAEGATAALAREPGEAADLEAVRVALRLAKLALLRAARAMADAQAVTVSMMQAAEEAGHQKREEPEVRSPGLQDSRASVNATTRPSPGATTLPRTGEAPCAAS